MASQDNTTPPTEQPRDIGPDGEKIVDMSYYDILEVSGSATENDLKKAYRKLAIKWHPDKHPGGEHQAAEEKFKEIGEAYQVLSDSQLRAAYNKYGKKDAQGLSPEGGFEDPGKLFSMLFGGEKFDDWIGEISLGKDFSKAMDIQLTEEEKEEMRKEAAKAGGTATPASAVSPSVTGGATGERVGTPTSTGRATPGAATTANGTTEPPPDVVPDAPRASSPSAEGPKSNEGLKPSLDNHQAGTSSTELLKHVSPPAADTPPANASDTAPSIDAAAKEAAAAKEKEKKSAKMTPEQRKEMEKFEKERRAEQQARIEILVKKLKDRIRPFVEASHPGEKDDPETVSFGKRIREEAEDLKLESFGVELCRLIGTIYVSKSSNFLKLHRKPSSNFLGIPGFFSRLKEKGSTIKEGWSFLTSTLDVQVAMEDLMKKQEKGDLAEEDMHQLEADLTGKLLLVSWRGTSFEVSNILKEVVSRVLSKEDGSSDAVLMNRAKAILYIGSILKAVEPDETDEERRELERLVLDAGKKKPRRAKGEKEKEKPLKKE